MKLEIRHVLKLQFIHHSVYLVGVFRIRYFLRVAARTFIHSVWNLFRNLFQKESTKQSFGGIRRKVSGRALIEPFFSLKFLTMIEWSSLAKNWNIICFNSSVLAFFLFNFFWLSNQFVPSRHCLYDLTTNILHYSNYMVCILSVAQNVNEQCWYFEIDLNCTHFIYYMPSRFSTEPNRIEICWQMDRVWKLNGI